MTQIQLSYPKIPGSSEAPFSQCVAFEKYDGTNLHWVWDRELGWYAFGVRRNRYDLDDVGISEFERNHPGLSESIPLFRETFAKQFVDLIKSNDKYDVDEITVFTEFYGENSFAGKHQPDDTKHLVLIDVQIPDGMVPPTEFVSDFASLPIARVVYRGKLTGKFTNDVRNGRFDVFEGVVCKGGTGIDNLWMAKIKTNAYMKRLQDTFKDDWHDYWE